MGGSRAARRIGRVAGAVLLLSFVAAVTGRPVTGDAGANGPTTVPPLIGGRVFLDRDANGVEDAGEPGVAGVVVEVTAADGTSAGTTVTDVAGDWTITLPAGSAPGSSWRVEHTGPADLTSAATGTGSGSSLQFAVAGTTDLRHGVARPTAWCADNVTDPTVVATCLRPGPRGDAYAATSTVARTTWAGTTPATVATKATTGAVWGLAPQPGTGHLWAAAVLRRHADLGPEGIGGLYVLDASTGALVTSFDLRADAGLALSAAADPATTYGAAARGITTDWRSADLATYPAVGREGLGDIEISADGRYLWVTDLYGRTVHRFALGDTDDDGVPELGTRTGFAVPAATCASATEVRPFGLHAITTGVLVGVVCSNETATFAAANTPNGAKVLALDAATGVFSTVADVGLGAVRDVELGCTTLGTTPCTTAQWHAWTDSWDVSGTTIDIKGRGTAIGEMVPVDEVDQVVARRWWPQPLLTGITVLDDGAIVVAFADRFSLQFGTENYEPVGISEDLFGAFATGDLVLLCPNGTGFQQESDGSCAGRTAVGRSWAGLNATTPYREFFDDNVFAASGEGSHLETTHGGVVGWHGDLVVGATAPTDAGDTAGLRRYDGDDGERTGGVVLAATGATDAHVDTFRASTSIGDVELFCPGPPTQIGNRVWWDRDADGHQDADEGGIAGVTLHLRSATGTVVGTAVTGADGTWAFDSRVDTDPGDAVGGGFRPDRAFTVHADHAPDHTGTGPLAGFVTTARHVGPTSTDSDAAVVAGWPTVTVGVATLGVNDHTLDLGFHRPGVAVGGSVWWDQDADGVRDVGEAAVTGAVVGVTQVGGGSALDPVGETVGSTTSGVGGAYSFASLVGGHAYRVTATAPAGYLAGSGAVADSAVLTTHGSSETALDVALLGIGGVTGIVWDDTDGDGVRDTGEPGRSGVPVRIVRSGGAAATDASGTVVAPVGTSSDGSFGFGTLALGFAYVVAIDLPTGSRATTAAGATTPLLASPGATSDGWAFGLAELPPPPPPPTTPTTPTTPTVPTTPQPVPAPAPPPAPALAATGSAAIVVVVGVGLVAVGVVVRSGARRRGTPTIPR